MNMKILITFLHYHLSNNNHKPSHHCYCFICVFACHNCSYLITTKPLHVEWQNRKNQSINFSLLGKSIKYHEICIYTCAMMMLHASKMIAYNLCYNFWECLWCADIYLLISFIRMCVYLNHRYFDIEGNEMIKYCIFYYCWYSQF